MSGRLHLPGHQNQLSIQFPCSQRRGAAIDGVSESFSEALNRIGPEPVQRERNGSEHELYLYVTPYSLEDIYQWLGRTSRLNLSSRRESSSSSRAAVFLGFCQLAFCFDSFGFRGHAVARWLRHYVASRKVASLRRDGVNESFSVYRILPAAPCSGLGFSQPLTEMSTRNKKIVFLGSRARPVRKAYNLTAICGQIV
jgi:hypothetical protein